LGPLALNFIPPGPGKKVHFEIEIVTEQGFPLEAGLEIINANELQTVS
jgi:hypothetical protein